MNISDMTAVEIGKAIKARQLSSVEVTKYYLDNIEKKEDKLNAFITIDYEGAIKRAEAVQKRILNGDLTSELAGVPMAVKDNICTKEMRTTCASRMLKNYIPSYSATAVERLENAGGVLIGKTNMDEFAMGSTTETSCFGATKNPHNIEYIPGGSSGGSCAAVAAGEVAFSLGSDTGGSIRQPAAFCGVTGLKPTYGRVSRYGLIAYASCFEQIGPIGKDIRDCATILESLAFKDAKDSTSIGQPCNFTSALREDIKGLKIGIPREYFGAGLDAQIKDSIFAGIKKLEENGASIEEFSLDYVDYAVPAYYIIASAQASSNLARYDGVKYGYRAKEYENVHDMYKKSRSEGFGEEVKKRIMLGAFALSAGYYDEYYIKAQKTCGFIKKNFDEAFKKYDVILAPVWPTAVPKLNETLQNLIAMYMGDVYTVAANIAGLPAVSVPVGKDKNGLPIGVQFMANLFREDNIIRVAYAFEKMQGM